MLIMQMQLYVLYNHTTKMGKVHFNHIFNAIYPTYFMFLVLTENLVSIFYLQHISVLPAIESSVQEPRVASGPMGGGPWGGLI